jgi:hypothetical protein
MYGYAFQKRINGINLEQEQSKAKQLDIRKHMEFTKSTARIEKSESQKNPKSRNTSSPNQSDDEIEIPQVHDKQTESLSHNHTIPENEIAGEEEPETPPVTETSTIERRKKTANDCM